MFIVCGCRQFRYCGSEIEADHGSYMDSDFTLFYLHASMGRRGSEFLSKDQTPKQRLLAWIQSKIPEKNITNFTTDWNDGTAIAALVEALAPGQAINFVDLMKVQRYYVNCSGLNG
jgi:hypothetical protein